ncbi:ssDNA-binding protein, mitochondrial [Loxospora ochrophaea]|nr:ssDNA-binding protein, mitochondrial [Loxospora ochrophaea]
MRPPSLRLQPFLSHARLFSSTPRLPVARITLVGRIGAEPELQPTSTGTDIVRYVIGTNSGPPDNRQTSWWRVAAFPNEGPSRDRLMGLAKG